MARWIKLKKRALELNEWINLEHAVQIIQNTQQEKVIVHYPNQEIQIKNADNPEAYQQVVQYVTDAPPFL